MIIYDLPHPILSAIPRPHLLQLQAATVREETHRNAKYCSAGAHALSALRQAHRTPPTPTPPNTLAAFPSVCVMSGLGDGNLQKKKRKENLICKKSFVLALTYAEKCWGEKLGKAASVCLFR